MPFAGLIKQKGRKRPASSSFISVRRLWGGQASACEPNLLCDQSLVLVLECNAVGEHGAVLLDGQGADAQIFRDGVADGCGDQLGVDAVAVGDVGEIDDGGLGHRHVSGFTRAGSGVLRLTGCLVGENLAALRENSVLHQLGHQRLGVQHGHSVHVLDEAGSLLVRNVDGSDLQHLRGGIRHFILGASGGSLGGSRGGGLFLGGGAGGHGHGEHGSGHKQCKFFHNLKASFIHGMKAP